MLTHARAEGDESGGTLDLAAPTMMNALAGKLDPALASPVVAFLAHEDCPVTGEIYTAGAGHVARYFIGRTKGFYQPDLSIESVRDHLSEIRDETGYTTPRGRCRGNRPAPPNDRGRHATRLTTQRGHHRRLQNRV
ncbi:hypothetical protein [Nonomuraea basaltis]|uniref:hypothetical protein n=1 Tax=Nonomuraea basaltis TaxID=2495887 RepID=UPI00110C6F72|nr:hypothetical protein [Nonomuraea basaltis]TMR98895.1 hypothetical protein EJK15_10155 [Nonomuraea basaltis]